MSASLVGSEMCIRDRTRGAAASYGVRPSIGPQRSKGAAAGRSRAQTHAVSYTHLTLPTICSV
eukprot:14904169-Alexandrium_andersonii.AAC.1